MGTCLLCVGYGTFLVAYVGRTLLKGFRVGRYYESTN